MCFDLRQLILSKLSLGELARASRTCREFLKAYVSRVPEERACIIAFGKETYGEEIFCGVVRACHLAMCGLDPLDWDAKSAITDAAGAPKVYARLAWQHGPGTSSIWKPEPAFRRSSADAEVRIRQGPTTSSVLVQISGSSWRGVHLDVKIGTKAPVASLGLLLAICREDPADMLPHMPTHVTMQLAVEEVVGKWQAEQEIGPLGMLVDLFTIDLPPQVTVMPLGQQEERTGPRCLLKGLTLVW
jgi:hypothetical protein